MTNETKNSKPTHRVFHIRKFEKDGEKKNFWTGIGVAWPHKDGKGFNLKLECFPVDGEITIRPASEKKENTGR